MNRYLIAIICFLINVQGILSQGVINGEIEVIGYSEREIIPDEIWYEIEISDQKQGKEFIQLDKLEKDLWQIIEELGIDKSRIELDHTSSRKLEYRRNRNEIVRSKTYWVKFTDISELDKFAVRLEEVRINRSGIVKVNYSKLLELEDELKIEAIINAKNKAIKILEAIDEEIGKIKHITEMYGNDYMNYMLGQYLDYENIVMQSQSGMLYSGSKQELKYKKIKFRTTIKAVFEIKE